MNSFPGWNREAIVLIVYERAVKLRGAYRICGEAAQTETSRGMGAGGGVMAGLRVLGRARGVARERS